MSRFKRNESLERLQRNMNRLHSALNTSKELADVFVTIDDEPKCNHCEMYREIPIEVYDDGGSIDCIDWKTIAWYMDRQSTFQANIPELFVDEEELPF
jgi:hypothetical protein